jgi:hypothetical protein
MGISKKQVEDIDDAKRYQKYTWVGNRIPKSDMARLYRLKVRTKIPITLIVSQAIKEFLDKQECESTFNLMESNCCPKQSISRMQKPMRTARTKVNGK